MHNAFPHPVCILLSCCRAVTFCALQSEFLVEDVETIVKNVRHPIHAAVWWVSCVCYSPRGYVQALQATLSENMYNPKKVNDWTNSVIDTCLKGLQLLHKSFKYIGACHTITRGMGAQISRAKWCSDMHYHAEERRRVAHNSNDILGHQEGR